MFGNAGGLGDFTRRRAAVVLTGEQIARGGEQKLPWFATRPTYALGLGLLFG